MRNVKSILIVLVATAIWAVLATTSVGQEYKKGDQVVVLRDTELKVGVKTVGTVRKGEKLAIEKIQGGWLWVRSGQTPGWIQTSSVIGAALKAWYERQVDMTSWLAPDRPQPVDEFGRARPKIFGVTFDIHSLKPGFKPPPASCVTGKGNYVGGVRLKQYMRVDYGHVKIGLEEASESRWALSVGGKSHGLVRKGDHVLINGSREVFVNGQLRRPR